MIGSFLIIGINLVWGLIYYLEVPIINQYKFEKNEPWPWHSDPNFRQRLSKAFVLIFFNLFVMNNLCQLFLAHFVTDWKVFVNFDRDNLPSIQKVIKQLLLFTVMDDMSFYFLHRLFHTKSAYLPLYQMFHKVHHEFNHTITVAFIYVHPIEYIFNNWMVPYSGIWIVSFLYGRE